MFCEKLEKIHIGKNVELIWDRVFYGCESLAQITVEAGNAKYFSYENCLINFNHKRLLAVGCNADIPDISNIEYFAPGAFSSCPNLKTLYISRYIKTLNNTDGFGHPSAIFSNCSSIESITVNQYNPYFYGEGNCVIDRETGDLLVGCSTSIIPTTSNVTKIKAFAFYGCEAMTSITIPKNIKKIETSAFSDCVNLTDVYYDGTKAEWDAIAPGTWNSFGSESCVLHCTDGDFEVEYKEVFYQ